MLPKSQRLTTEAFKEIIEKGQSFHGPFLIVRKIHKTGSMSFGVSVPKKVAHSAVMRNKLHRRVYSLIRKLPLHSGYASVVILKHGADKLSLKEFALELEKIFVKSLLLK